MTSCLIVDMSPRLPVIINSGTWVVDLRDAAEEWMQAPTKIRSASAVTKANSMLLRDKAMRNLPT
jgi:hypothetical protein